jgi:hypothetical protein
MQVGHVVAHLRHLDVSAYDAVLAQFPEFDTLVWCGGWVDFEASNVDPEYMCWVADCIESVSLVYWEDGEPWWADNSNCGNDHLDVCADCLIVAVNGDTSGINDPIREDEVLEGIDRYLVESGRYLVAGDGEPSFNRCCCELCGTGDAGDRYEMVGI